jgi:hypothetical protein
MSTSSLPAPEAASSELLSSGPIQTTLQSDRDDVSIKDDWR